VQSAEGTPAVEGRASDCDSTAGEIRVDFVEAPGTAGLKNQVAGFRPAQVYFSGDAKLGKDVARAVQVRRAGYRPQRFLIALLLVLKLTIPAFIAAYSMGTIALALICGEIDNICGKEAE
jgi:hypothetical protein